jgi:HipA-like protein
MRQAYVFSNKQFMGTLTEENRQNYVFRYEDNWFRDAQKPAVSLTMPKTKQEYRSAYLFPFFENMLSEGANKALQCRHLRIDENDSFGLLLATAQWETIGAITIKPVNND